MQLPVLQKASETTFSAAFRDKEGIVTDLQYKLKVGQIFILKPKDMINGKVMGIDNASLFFLKKVLTF